MFTECLTGASATVGWGYASLQKRRAGKGAEQNIMAKVSKNRDVTRLVNFRLRVTDLEKLDKFKDRNNWSRTYAVEHLIRNHTVRKATR